jgi:hypothetical protein
MLKSKIECCGPQWYQIDQISYLNNNSSRFKQNKKKKLKEKITNISFQLNNVIFKHQMSFPYLCGMIYDKEFKMLKRM